MLYDELERRSACSGQWRGRDSASPPPTPRTALRTILIGLDANLDHSAGGDVAAALSRVYRSMRRKLDEAIAANHEDGFAEVLDGIRTIAEAWRQLR